MIAFQVHSKRKVLSAELNENSPQRAQADSFECMKAKLQFVDLAAVTMEGSNSAESQFINLSLLALGFIAFRPHWDNSMIN